MPQISPFTNEAFTDFSIPANKQAFEKALENVQSQLGQKHDCYIDGDAVNFDEQFSSTNPGNTSQVLGQFPKLTVKHAEQAVQAALKAFPTWSNTAASERADYLFKAAAIIRERKHTFSAWMVLEAGKSWAEADGDTAEAIDFLEFYAREMLRLDQGQELTKLDGEDNELHYIALGVGAIVPPWNFPLAICVGMATSAIVAGNPIVLKPASDTPCIANEFVKVMQEIGLPKGVLNFITGSGAVLGDYLVKHPKIRFVSFTGSKEVGLNIVKEAAITRDKQIWIKRVVAEMGGKDGTLVNSDADLEAAAQGIVKAAFGFQGQKCSACSRAIIHADVYDQVKARVLELTAEIVQGDQRDVQNFMGPVINASAKAKILEYIEIGKNEGQLLCGGQAVREDQGHYIAPTIIEGITPEHRLFQEEIFGPVLALCKVDSFDQGIEWMNNSEFGLTAAVYTQDKANIARAKNEIFAGNLYINRKCTGALVGVHPFGGFNMSGTDSKAGGKDYLLHFTQGKLISEKV